MRDTLPEVETAFTALFATRSASERIRMASDMLEAAKALMVADIRAKSPGISPADLRVEMFARLYFGDFDADLRARMIKALHLRSM